MKPVAFLLLYFVIFTVKAKEVQWAGSSVDFKNGKLKSVVWWYNPPTGKSIKSKEIGNQGNQEFRPETDRGLVTDSQETEFGNPGK